jgi:hypothetical protein
VDDKSDLWALAVIVHECLVAKRPFEDQVLARLAEKICRDEPTPPSQLAQLPLEFDAWFLKALAKAREHRFQSPREMIEGLERALKPAIDGEARVSADAWSEPIEEGHAPRRGTGPTRKVQARQRGYVRLFFEGMLVCAVTFLVGFGIFFVRRTWDDVVVFGLGRALSNPVPLTAQPPPTP